MSDILAFISGLGLFLLGMAVMTEGLRNLAGETLRRALAKFTTNPLTGVLTGTISTSVVQSSSATTVMAVGFVGAGLLSFPQALGIVFGANIGTTITGWLVALLGFKLSLKAIVLPLIFPGALMHLFGQRRVSAAGYALAGFGLVFAGISMLQSSMEAFRDVVTPDSFPPDTWFGRLLLVLLGIAITLVTQSSSAGVAAAITAVHVGNMSLSQAASLVIGMDVGTTITAVLASVGGNVDARRTALAHVIYNLLTALLAFICLPFYLRGWEALTATHQPDAEIALVTFHTLFNTLGVMMVLPFTRQFAALIVKLLPVQQSSLTRRLEPSLLGQPNVALASVRVTLIDTKKILFEMLATLLKGKAVSEQLSSRLQEAEQGLDETRRYLNQLHTNPENVTTYALHVSLVHALDHLERLLVRCRNRERIQTSRTDEELARFADRLAECVDRVGTDLCSDNEVSNELERVWQELDGRAEPYRRSAIERTVSGEGTIDTVLAQLDTIRWLRRICNDAWRIEYHLAGPEDGRLAEPVGEEQLELD